MGKDRKHRRARLDDVARLAGVGVATVDRVLNERGNVSVKTAQKVLEAARTLEINRILPSAHQKTVRIELLLARPEIPLIARMSNEFRKLPARMDRSVIIQQTILTDEGPETMAQALRRTRCDAVIVYTQEHDAIHRAIGSIAAKGIPTVTIISDLPRSLRLAYAGIDHYKAGRTAGYFIDGMVRRQGSVLILCNHLGFQAHAARLRGFKEFLAGSARRLHISEIVKGRDDDVLSELLLRPALARHPDTVAIYNVGGGNRGVAAAIRNLARNDRPLFVGHELTDVNRELLNARLMALAIDQNSERQAHLALEMALERVGFTGEPPVKPAHHPSLPFTVYSPENVLE
ncbi:LacI family DNA-binding transcriptional regulator [Rhizobium giardinii]|uniref:LacI family transcriptional regulator n=1 Tax=Rhizobium giardinii TaxID=56731 RepID=A0A7W8U8U9_9HYPH|nr:LacI family DNA-binding transcriptional regulator [Rhizobium giardinii]MBB5533565.1 LacI family transcriptional regulator [Rhizobium giardinii]